MKKLVLASAALIALSTTALYHARLHAQALQSVAQPERNYSVNDFELQDDARKRAVPVRLYLPDEASASKRVPLVIFSHGIGGSRLGYSYLGRYLAEQGFAVMHLQHAGSDRAVWSSGSFGILSVASNLRDAASESNAIARAQDVSFAISQALTLPQIKDKLDAERIAVAGHSYGANTALLAAGAQVEREGKLLSFKDERIKAAIIISAPPFYNDQDARGILKGIALPTLHITGTEDVIRVPGYYSDAKDRIAIFESMPGVRKTLAVFKGASHSVFTDRMAGTAELSRDVKRSTRELAALFLGEQFFGEKKQSVRAWLTSNEALLAKSVFAE